MLLLLGFLPISFRNPHTYCTLALLSLPLTKWRLWLCVWIVCYCYCVSRCCWFACFSVFFFVSLFVCGLVIRILSLCQCEHRSYQMTIPFRVWCSLSQIECCVCLSRVLCTHAESVAEDHYASVFLFGVLLFFCVQTMNFADLLSVSFYLLIVSFACVWSED